jgi:hypothetical protein
MKKPNFFIIGAPKCGTTSLAAWLATNPNIFFSSYKEPHHFNTDENWVWTPEREQYEELFKGVTREHHAVGEGSVWYLYSRVAVLNIEKYTPNAKYIVCLRNPVQMAYSLHGQQLVSGNEHIEDFEEAWVLNDARLRGEAVSRWCREPRHLAYGKACLLGEQLERLYRCVPRERVHIMLLDDVKADPRSVYISVLQFLGADDDGRSDFSVENPAKQRKSVVVNRMVQLMGNAKRYFNIKKSFGLLGTIDRRNIRYQIRQPLSDEMKYMLQEYFSEDIALLGRLIDRDLSHWLNNAYTRHTGKNHGDKD